MIYHTSRFPNHFSIGLHVPHTKSDWYCGTERVWLVKRQSTHTYLRASSASAERVGGVTCRVTCTSLIPRPHPRHEAHTRHAHAWCLLGLAVKVMAGTGWATSRPDCMDRLTKHYSHLVGGWFLARKAVWALSGCMTTGSAGMLVNECEEVKVTSLLIEVDLGLETEMETWSVKDMLI